MSIKLKRRIKNLVMERLNMPKSSIKNDGVDCLNIIANATVDYCIDRLDMPEFKDGDDNKIMPYVKIIHQITGTLLLALLKSTGTKV